MTDRFVIIRHDHGEGKIPDFHEPVWLGESVMRDRSGRPHRFGFTRFARVICNNPGCPFEALVSEGSIVEAAR